jgi:hypothetical protein
MTMENPLDQDAERRRIQRGRNIAMGLLLGGLVILFYLITIAKISG